MELFFCVNICCEFTIFTTSQSIGQQNYYKIITFEQIGQGVWLAAKRPPFVMFPLILSGQLALIGVNLFEAKKTLFKKNTFCER